MYKVDETIKTATITGAIGLYLVGGAVIAGVFLLIISTLFFIAFCLR